MEYVYCLGGFGAIVLVGAGVAWVANDGCCEVQLGAYTGLAILGASFLGWLVITLRSGCL